jgi:hypothetical protein
MFRRSFLVQVLSNLAQFREFHNGLHSLCKLRTPTGNHTPRALSLCLNFARLTGIGDRARVTETLLSILVRLFLGLWQRLRNCAVRPAILYYADPNCFPHFRLSKTYAFGVLD